MNAFQKLYILLLAILVVNCNDTQKQKAEGSTNTKTNKKPNIVLLFVDDQGWSDVGYRNDKFETPNINKLKSQGVEFTRAYVPTPTCSPSRASLLTGRESARMQMVRHIESRNAKDEAYNFWATDPEQMPSINRLPLEEVTYAEKLKEHGYYNAFIGKWHLGLEPYYPIHQGFDEMYGTGDHGMPNDYYFPFFKEGEELKDRKKGEYLTNVLTDKAVDFIKTYNKDQPFMLSLWYYNVHSPHIGRKDLVKKYEAKGLTGDDAQYAAMVEAMDESIGKVRKALTEKGLSKNTVILYISDQGGTFSNAPLSGGKMDGNTLGEGGSRVPFIISFPGVSKAGTEIKTPIQTIDVFPTLMEIATGTKYNDNNINGKSLLPLLKGEKLNERNLYFFRSYEDQRSAVINGDWKLIRYHSGKFQLFNVVQDISEQHNLIDAEPKIAERLKKDLKKWETEAIPFNNGSLK